MTALNSTSDPSSSITHPSFFEVHSLPYANGKPLLTGLLRQQPDDFFVEEILGFEPEGEGEHVFLWIEKRGLNTQQVAERLARLASVAIKKVSYSGMKDRHAVTRQWFSVHLPEKLEPDWQQLTDPQVSLLRHDRHSRKLRRGAHKANRFIISLVELTAADMDSASNNLAERIESVRRQGFPNYFGEQRFGRQGMNLVKASQWFEGKLKPKRHLRGIYLSSARSSLFNRVLAKRVAHGSWCELLSGELLLLDGTNSVFQQSDDDELVSRLKGGDIHPTGPLYGKAGKLSCDDEVASLESETLLLYPPITEGLEKAGLKAERRALRVVPKQLEYQINNERLELSFILPSGSFATALIRELIDYSMPANK